MNNGYIKMYRKITNSFVWTHPHMFKLWTLCLMKASHRGNKFLFNGQEIVVDSGQFVTGRAAITKDMNDGVSPEHQVNRGSVWRWLKKFEKEEMLNIKSTTKYSVISICNWSEYQQSEQQVNNDRTASEQRPHTNKNAKNAKNAKKKDNNVTSPKSKKRIYEDDSDPYKLATLLFEKIKENNSEAKEPNLQSWADDMRKTMELDGRKYDQVKNMINWSQRNEFWSGVVLSAKKIREKYDQMKVQANNEFNKSKGSNGKASARKESLPDWVDKEEDDETLDEEEQEDFKNRLKQIRDKKMREQNGAD